MPANTDCVSLPYPVDADQLDIAGDFSRLANRVDDELCAIKEQLQLLVSSFAPIGTIWLSGNLDAPTGWMLARGQAISRSTYSALFAAYGTRFGAGNGTTTFNLPDLRGRLPVGFNDGGATGETAGMWVTAVGERAGWAKAQVPSHVHPMNHGHNGSAVAVPDHVHTIPARLDPISGSLGSLGVSNSGGTIQTRSSNPAGGHGHTVNIVNFSGSTNAQANANDATFSNYPPGQSFNFIVRVL